MLTLSFGFKARDLAFTFSMPASAYRISESRVQSASNAEGIFAEGLRSQMLGCSRVKEYSSIRCAEPWTVCKLRLSRYLQLALAISTYSSLSEPETSPLS